ncbi:MAG: hypothetical protein M1514_01285 [Patescibacteria group bacterium]|nr:hypothetical protein [Patescibacteria group bacterium]
MNKNYPLSELQEKINSCQKVLLVLPARPNFDQVAAALAFSLSLETFGKTVSVVCPSAMTVEFNHLVGVNKITTKLQGTDLLITLNYSPDYVERVSYNDDNNRPNIIVQPKAGAPPLSESMASFSYSGLNADLIMAFGVRDQSGLQVNGQSLGGNFLVDIDTDPTNFQFGQLNIIDPEAAALSEVILGIISGLNLPLSVDIAQNLLSGLSKRTQGLTSPSMNADTYEAVAICLRNGAQKLIDSSPKREEYLNPKPQPRLQPREEKRPSLQDNPEDKGKKPPADWFEPKIFKGTNIS